ncbi:TlpA disulfide reductase family protein [candidate division KSB1 bacterium]
MKRITHICLFAALAFAFCGKTADETSGAEVMRDPAITEVDVGAVVKAVANHKGKVVLVNMWATWCEPCVEEFPDLVSLHRKYRDRGLEVIGVSHDFHEMVESDLIPFIKEQGADFTHFLQNGQTAQDFIDGIDPIWSGVLPATLVYDREGIRVKYIPGRFDTGELEDLVLTLLEQQ